MTAFEDAKRRYEVPWSAAVALKKAMKGGDVGDLSIDEEVGFLLLADFMGVVRDFHSAYLKVK